MANKEDKRYHTLRHFLEEKQTEPEVVHEVVKRAIRQRSIARKKNRQESDTLEALKLTLGDLNLSEDEFKNAYHAYESDLQEEAERKTGLRHIVIGLGILAGFILTGSYFAYSSTVSQFQEKRNVVLEAYSEVELQLDRADAIKGQLVSLIENREEFKSKQIADVVAKTPAQKLPAVLAKYSSVLDDKAFLVLLTEVSGSINRIVVAKRRYNKARARFIQSLQGAELEYLEEQPVPETQKIYQKELQTGP